MKKGFHLFAFRNPVIIEKILCNFRKNRRGSRFGVLGTAGPFDFYDHNEFRIGGGSESSVGSYGVTRFPDFVFPFRSDLRCSRFSCNIISVDSSFSRKPYFRPFSKHSDDLLGSVFLDNATKRGWGIFHHCSIRERERVDDVGLHIDSSVCESGIGGCHLENRCGYTLSERHGKEFRSGPFFIRIDFSEYFPLEGDIGFSAESEIVDILMEQGFSYLLHDIDHTDITTPIERVSIGVASDTLIGDIFYLVLIDFHIPFIGVGIGRFDIARIDSYRHGDGFENGTRFIEGTDRIGFVGSGSEHIFVFVLRYRPISDFYFGCGSEWYSFPADEYRQSFFGVFHEERKAEKIK